MSQITLTIDGVRVTVPPGATIFEAARRAGIYIPGLCFHPDLPIGPGRVGLPRVYRDSQILAGSPDEFLGCGLCVVEAEGELVPACSASAREGIGIQTGSARVKAERQDRLAEILAYHPHACLTCPHREGCDRIACPLNVPLPERCCAKFAYCELRRVADYVGIKPDTPRYIFRGLPVLEGERLFVRDYNLCVACTRCVRVCAEVRGVGALDFTVVDGRAQVGSVAPSLAQSGCKFCTACVEVCPTGALMDRPADIKGVAKEESLVPCRAACPAGIDVPRYVNFIAEGKYGDALAAIREEVPFPRVLGYVCFHPCEDVCRRGKVNEPLAICALKRFAAEHGDSRVRVQAARATGKAVAIVGSGPAGLAAAYYLRAKGHGVTVFEAVPEPGGMLRYGIPRYRLPLDALCRDIDDIVDLGVKIELNTPVGQAHGVSLAELRRGYDAVFLAVGAQVSKKIPLEGSHLEGVLWGLDFLREVNQGLWPGTPLGRVVVIGGGNVAMDVALTAWRLGAEEIQIACLESRAEMPAFEWEIEQVLDEGMVLHPSWGPKRVLGERRVGGIELIRCTRVFDEQGRFNPSFDPSTSIRLAADTVILAIGQSTDLSFLDGLGQELKTERGTIRVDETTLATAIEGLFAAGEAVSGPSSVVQAIAGAKRAAAALDRFLGGDGEVRQRLAPPLKVEPWIGHDRDFASWPRVSMPCLPLSERRRSFAAIELGFDEAMARQEATRCLRCYLRLELAGPILPAEPWIELDLEHVASVPEVEGVYRLLDEGKEVLRIAGTANLRQSLEAEITSQPKARYFVYEEARMYTQRESELLQEFLQKYGRLPPGNELADELF